MNLGGGTIQCMPFCPSIPKLMSLLHATHIYFVLTAAEVLTDSSINSIKPEVSSKYHLNQIWVRLSVWFILRQNSSLAVSEPLKSDKLGVSKIQWWDRHKIDIAIPKGRDGKGKRDDGSQASSKPHKANTIRAESLRTILFGSMPWLLELLGWWLCLAGP